MQFLFDTDCTLNNGRIYLLFKTVFNLIFYNMDFYIYFINRIYFQRKKASEQELYIFQFKYNVNKKLQDFT